MSADENVIEDPYIAAYCHLKGLKIIPFKKSNQRVAFIVRNNIEVVITEIFENKKVPINDYLKSLKAVRSAMFTLKNSTQSCESDYGKSTD